MSTVEYTRIRSYGITPALCIIACLCFGFLALVVWDTILTIALERNNDFRSNDNNGTLVATSVPSPTPITVPTAPGPTPPATVVLLGNNNNVFDVPIAVVAGAGKHNERAAVLASKKTQLKAAVLADNNKNNNGSGNNDDDDDDNDTYKNWKADIAVVAGGGGGGGDDDNDDNAVKWQADVAVAPGDDDGDDDDDNNDSGNAANAGNVDDGLDRFNAVVNDDSSDASDTVGAGGGSANITFGVVPTPAPSRGGGGGVAKRDNDAAEIRLARGAINTGNKFIDDAKKKAKETPKQAAKPHQEQQASPRILSMAERRQALIDVQKQARDAELQRMKRV